MALQKGVNSYGDVSDADAYFSDRLDVAAWTGATSDRKGQALVTACAMLDGLEWRGYAVSEDQTQAFPRVGEYIEPKLGRVLCMDPTPDRILKASFEQAYHLLNNAGLLDDTGRVRDLAVSGVNLTKIEPASRFPKVVTDMIKPLLARGSVNNRSWWRAN